jgi:DNA repair photolyase
MVRIGDEGVDKVPKPKLLKPTDIPVRLAEELPSLRERGMIAFGSGVTDPYRSIEAQEMLTGACSRQLAESKRARPI